MSIGDLSFDDLIPGNGAQASGMIESGNLDPFKRKILNNADGSQSTALTMGIGTDRGEVVIPQVVDGKRLSPADAIARYKATNEHFGIFDTPANASAYAANLHSEMEKRLPPTGIASLSFDDLIPKKDELMRGPQGVAEDANPLQALMIGAGRGFSQIGAGAQQAAYGLGSMLGIPGADQKQAELAASQKEADRIYKPMQEAHPLTSGVGEYLPSFAIPVGGTATLLGAMGKMALPGAMQALASYGAPEERLKEAALQGAGGAVGGGVASLAGKILSPAVGSAARAANPELERLAGVAKDAGVTLNPAQLGGGKFAQGVQAALNDIPWTRGGQQALQDAQEAAFSKAMLGEAGSTATYATKDVMGDLKTSFGPKFGAAVANVEVPINQSANALIDQIGGKYAARLDSMQRPIVANVIDDIKAAGPKITGEQFQTFASDLATAARSVTDNPTKNALNSLRKVLDDSFRAAAPADQAKALFETRTQYKNMLAIERALENSRTVDGEIPPKAMYAAMLKFNPRMTTGTGGQAADISRMGRQFLPDPIPNSGTPGRNAMMNLLTMGAMGGSGAGISQATTGDPMAGLYLGLGGYGTSKIAQRVFNSSYPRWNYVPDELKRIATRGGGLLGTGVAAGELANR